MQSKLTSATNKYFDLLKRQRVTRKNLKGIAPKWTLVCKMPDLPNLKKLSMTLDRPALMNCFIQLMELKEEFCTVVHCVKVQNDYEDNEDLYRRKHTESKKTTRLEIGCWIHMK
jgi:hypothetical protein